MTGDEATLAVIDCLEALSVPYVVVGSFSSNVYGIPRSTHDADFVIQVGPGTVRAVADRLGPPFQLDPPMSFETVTMTARHILKIADLHFTVELFQLSDDPHDQERFRRRRRLRLLGRDVFLPTVEDVIVTKLRWAASRPRSKDWDDLRSVIAVQAGRIDWDFVHGWCDRHGTRPTLDEIRQSIPPI